MSQMRTSVERMNKVLFSSTHDHWKTPQIVFDNLDKEFHFNDDPCPLYGIGGLSRNWNTNVFVNPPYSNIRPFLEKSIIELKSNSNVIVFLIPSRTDTKWWHEIVLPYATEIRFIKGRLKFGNAINSAPFPSVIVVFKRREN